MRPMRPDDILKIRFVSDPRISPGGRRVAFVLTSLSQERDEYLSNIWMVDTTGGAPPRRFTTGPGRDTAPRWSPDGARLAFVSERERGKKGQLMVMPVEGGEALALTQLRNGVAAPAWSPDGTRLAFVSRVGGWQEPESEEERKKSRPARVVTTLKYRFNGEGFIHDRPTHVFVVPAAGGAPAQLTSGDCPDSDPAWSPDGHSIAFVSARHEDRDYDDATDLWMVPAAGGTPRRVTDTIGPAMHPAFSPDGRTLAYLGRRHQNEFGRNVRVFTVPVEGGAPRSLTDVLDRSCAPLDLAPIWSADGAWLTFAAEDAGALSVYRVRAAGGAPAPERVIGGERAVMGVSAATDGTLAFVVTDPVTPPEVATCAADGSGERHLTDFNAAWRAEVALARPERFRFKRAGLTVDGWIMKPVGFTAEGRYPGLLNIHGGPHAQYGWVFFDEFQVQAGAGYAVVYTNPRGSQGYGEAFTRAVVGDWGGGDFADVMAGLDEALRRAPWIDPDRLGVLGGSYGGFLTSWTVGHTDRFRAACSERAVNYHPSMFGTSDIGHLFNEVEIGGLPWEMPDKYAERSPLTHAKNIHTPLLIIHSEDDLRCPIEQGEQLFVALKKQRKDAVFVRFPDENHELSRSGKPRHRLERFRIILDWFTRRLAPEPARGR
ncbi:MAG TPA: S9 family peptidase [Methylomirabilota bacterium]|nr:S9 family peptidase [Methylomirabilota bacterium]